MGIDRGFVGRIWRRVREGGVGGRSGDLRRFEMSIVVS